MKLTLRFPATALLGAALMMPLATAPLLRAADNNASTFHDKKHNDDHVWNAQEEKAYRIYWKEHNRPYANFPTLKEDDRQAYWDWRHNHSDAQLGINK
jgi:hypothetical protein